MFFFCNVNPYPEDSQLSNAFDLLRHYLLYPPALLVPSIAQNCSHYKLNPPLVNHVPLKREEFLETQVIFQSLIC